MNNKICKGIVATYEAIALVFDEGDSSKMDPTKTFTHTMIELDDSESIGDEKYGNGPTSSVA